jgi:hypothetical protein
MTTRERGVINARQIAQCRPNADGTKAAPVVRGKAAQELAKHVAAGTIKAISGSTLTVTTLKGQDATVNTTANTVVFNNGFTSVSALKVGDKIELFGRPEKATPPTGGGTAPATRTLTAWAIRVNNGTTTLMIGHVQSVSGNTVVLRTPKNRAGVQVNLSSSTGYKTVAVTNNQPTVSNATQADVKAGTNLIVEGAASADGKLLTAKAVLILPGGKLK